MSHTFVFNGVGAVRRRVEMEELIKQAAGLLDGAHRALIGLQKSGSNSAGLFDYRKWFGVMDATRLGRVTSVVSIMDFALNEASITFIYNTATVCTPGVNAAGTYTDKARAETIREALHNKNYTVHLCQRLFTQMSAVSSIEQSSVGTLVHELSHALGDTIDVDDDHISGAKDRFQPADDNANVRYGKTAAVELAKNYPAWAVENAENYGFYVTVAWGR